MLERNENVVETTINPEHVCWSKSEYWDSKDLYFRKIWRLLKWKLCGFIVMIFGYENGSNHKK